MSDPSGYDTMDREDTALEAAEKLRAHIEGLFAGAPGSRDAYELKEELLANSLERYTDLTNNGMDADEALHQVLGSIGNVEELIDALPRPERVLQAYPERDNRSAMLITISVGLYILALVVLVIGLLLNSFMIALAVALLLCIVPTCLLVYKAVSRPSYKRKDDTVVENFKQWNADSKKSRALYFASTALLWSLCTVIYLIVSFVTGAWSVTWITFLIALCLQAALTLGFVLKGMNP